MIEKGLISLIVPCYNIAKVCDDFFKSVLNQTYKNIELVCVNDGSTDDTEEKLLYYKEIFEKENFKFKYIFQENKGLGGAINTGLKAFTGEYLCWADPDDYFMENSFELRYNFIKDQPEYACVSSDSYYAPENEGPQEKYRLSKLFPKSTDEKQFYHLLNDESIFCAGCHMIRTEDFLKVNPNREIYPARRGQNWQLLLPIFYSFKRYFLNVPLYFYTVNVSSMSHSIKEYEDKLNNLNEKRDLLISTVSNIEISSDSERKKINKLIESIIIKDKISIDKQFGKKNEVIKGLFKLAILGKLKIRFLANTLIIK